MSRQIIPDKTGCRVTVVRLDRAGPCRVPIPRASPVGQPKKPFSEPARLKYSKEREPERRITWPIGVH
jgi:hypothetical protein